MKFVGNNRFSLGNRAPEERQRQTRGKKKQRDSLAVPNKLTTADRALAANLLRPAQRIAPCIF
jgi:hypothetical protein